MGQSKFVWIIIYKDSSSNTFLGTWDELLKSKELVEEPIAIIRGELLWT